LSAGRKATGILKKLFNLEVMAVQIYMAQTGSMAGEERTMMVAARENEELHRETFRSLLAARGTRPPFYWPAFWLVGQTLGRVTSLFGRKAILRGDITFEDKATHEYADFIEMDCFNEKEMGFLKEFLEDEKRHSANWRALLTDRS